MQYVQSRNNPNWIAETDEGSRVRYKARIDGDKLAFNSTHGHDLIPATEKQIAHLKACIAADKYVEWNKNMLETNYEIY